LPFLHGAAVVTLYEAPPPVTPLSITLLVAAFVVAPGCWQRARFIQIHIHPETRTYLARLA